MILVNILESVLVFFPCTRRDLPRFFKWLKQCRSDLILSVSTAFCCSVFMNQVRCCFISEIVNGPLTFFLLQLLINRMIQANTVMHFHSSNLLMSSSNLSSFWRVVVMMIMMMMMMIMNIIDFHYFIVDFSFLLFLYVA